ncbi:MAG: DNA-directed RNA polymerase subunit alpha [Candidatus Doudnabacteria bacterium]|nr:DNA-directed RNA polymerase subunit alpha [Candidatus Doudnabacteria bacterium]
MEAISLPNRAKVTDLGNNKYSLTLEPLYPGYGVTIGNAMRRVLLSSMPGAAVTSVKIKFVDHEFSTIPNVKEDVIQIILALKQLRVKSFSAEPVKLSVKVKGEKVVTAADIKETDQVQVINKDLHIATLDNKNSEFDMELTVEQGRGYVPVEARENLKPEVGVIAIDAIFTPVKSVHFDVSNVRVGQLTNFDKLEIVMETDGSLGGQEAVDISAHILVDHFAMMFSNEFTKEEAVIAPEIPSMDDSMEAEEAVASGEENEIQASTLSTRAKNALVKNDITTMAALEALSNEQINTMAGLGDKTIKEILEFLKR